MGLSIASALLSVLAGGFNAIVAGVAVTAATLLVPTFRWERALRADTVTMQSLPEGALREHWTSRVEALAIKVAEYKLLVPRWDRVLGWVLSAGWVLYAGSFGVVLLTGASARLDWTAWQWMSVIAVVALGALFPWFMVTGRTAVGHRPRRYRAERDSNRAALRSLKAMRRAWRIRRREAH